MNTIVKDSSVWYDPDLQKAYYNIDSKIRMGIVKKLVKNEDTSEIKYLVEVVESSIKTEISCVLLRKFGGVYNYEDVVLRGYTVTNFPDITNDYAAKPGDTVLVACINGNTRDGVILGGLHHPGRKSDLDPDDGPQYKSSFNGVETFINKDGELKITAQGLPINNALLKVVPTVKVPPPIYNKLIGGASITLDKTGSIEINDNGVALKQYLKIDKSVGLIDISSGLSSIKIDRNAMSITADTTNLKMAAKLKVDISSTQFSVDSKATVKIKAPQIAIGTSGVELLALIAQLVDAIGKVAPISPVGPCSPLAGTPQWIQVATLLIKLKAITGSL